MRALRRKKHEPGLAEERRNLVHRYMGDETPAPLPAAEELQTGELVEEVVIPLPLTAATDVVANDAETPAVSSSAPRAAVVRDETPPPATEGLRADEAVEEVSLPSTAGTDVLANEVETPPVPGSGPRADVEVDTPRAVAPEPPAAEPAAPRVAAPDLFETLGREVDTPLAVVPEPPAPEPPAPPIAAADLLETLQPSAVGAALRTLEEVGRLCEQLARLGEEHGRWNALLAEKERKLVPPPGSPGP